MKLTKFLLGVLVISIIPIFTIVLADDCFDIVVDNNGKVFYVDPFDELSLFEDRKALVSIYGNNIKCSGEKKIYTQDEYLNKILGRSYNPKQVQRSIGERSSTETVIELIMLILGCVALRKIFVKAGKPGINSLIPVYNFYEMADIAGMSGLFKKAIWSGIIGFFMIFIGIFLYPIAYFPQIGSILVIIFSIYMCAVNYNIAKNFGWSSVASILYVLFNPIAMLILAFGNDKYCLTEQKEKMREISRKSHLKDNSDLNFGENRESIMEGMDEDLNVNTGQKNNSQLEEDPIKYIDPDQFT